MRFDRRLAAPAAALAVLLATGGIGIARADEMPDASPTAHARLTDARGREVGIARLRDTPHGVLVGLHFTGLVPGTHAIHLHEIGICEPPFASAGGHFNPDGVKHGLLAADGAHAGDLPNIHVPTSGDLVVEVLVPDVSLRGERGVLDADGTAIVVHAGPDDYRTDPAGAAGPRIACGVIGE